MIGPIAFVGLGRMGLPMSQNLARAGFAVRAWNRSDRAEAAPPGTDYLLVPSVEAAVAPAPIVVVMLPDLPDVREVFGTHDGAGGALSALGPGAIVVVMSTVSPVGIQAWAHELAARSVRVVDAPVSGGDTGARDGSLSIMVGGADEDVALVLPVLRAMGTRVSHFGPIGSGQLAKACNQIVVAATMTALGEAVTLGARGGLDVEQLLDALAGGLAGSRVLDVKRSMITGHSFAPGGLATSQLKDLGFALDAGRSLGVALPATALVDQLYAVMCATGFGGDDHSGIVQVIEALSRSDS